MTLHTMQCCAFQEIANLGSHYSGEEAMEAFCKTAWGTTTFTKYRGFNSKPKTLYCFYVFSAPTGGFYTSARQYGHDFAKFIKDNKLGIVMESPKALNLAFHADHSNILWVWAPDSTAVWKWWEAKQAAKKEVR